MLGACAVAVAAPTALGACRTRGGGVEAALLALTALLTDPADDARESAFRAPSRRPRLVVVAAALARIVGGEHTLPAALLATRGGSCGGLLAVTTP